jgi:hypothetical protein
MLQKQISKILNENINIIKLKLHFGIIFLIFLQNYH